MTKGFYKLSESLSPSIFRQKRGSYMRRSKLVVLLWSIECQEQDILPLSCFYIRTSSATLCVAPKHLESHSHAASRTTELIFSEMQFLVRCCDRRCRRGRCGTSRSRRHHNIDPRGLRHPGVLQPAPPSTTATSCELPVSADQQPSRLACSGTSRVVVIVLRALGAAVL